MWSAEAAGTELIRREAATWRIRLAGVGLIACAGCKKVTHLGLTIEEQKNMHRTERDFWVFGNN